MQCPVCDVTLSISSREGVEIDFCPQCRGVWLDRGELDKIIERNASLGAASLASPAASPPRHDDRPGDRDRYDDRYDDRRRDSYDRDDRGRDGDDYRRRRKKRSFLEDIFDFD